mgnify:CR=1 FL=1
MSNFQQGPQDLFAEVEPAEAMKVFWLFRSAFCFLYTAQFCPTSSLQMPSLYLEMRFFLDMSVLAQPRTEAPRHLFPGWWMVGSWKWKLLQLSARLGVPCQRRERPKFLLTSLPWSPSFLGLNKTSRHRYVNIPLTVLYWSELDVSLFHLFDPLSLATWLDRLPHVNTPFHGWNMLKRCFGLSSFEWPP